VRALPSGGAAAWVENARGLLIHLVRFEDERAATYRIVAPTEWNFHPEGAMAAALVGSPAPDPGTLTLRAVRIAHSLDPCVACRVEIDDA
jgi:Ni,Fe-hydrogenase I large subunit